MDRRLRAVEENQPRVVIRGSGGSGFQVPNGINMKTGYYYIQPHGAVSTLTPTLNVLYLSPVVLARPTNIDRIALEVTTLGATSVHRIGVYNTGSDGLPSALLYESGSTLSGATTGIKSTTVAVSLPAGTVWVGSVVQTATSVVRSCTGDPLGLLGSPTELVNISHSAYTSAATVTGALPSTFTVSALVAAGPAIAVRAA
jgi:hypothetical protein